MAAIGQLDHALTTHLVTLALLELTSDIASDRGVLVVVDDIHLLDPAG